MSRPLSAALGAVVLLVGAAATLGGLYAAGVELPFLKKAGPDYTGMVEIPLSGSAIPASSADLPLVTSQ